MWAFTQLTETNFFLKRKKIERQFRWYNKWTLSILQLHIRERWNTGRIKIISKPRNYSIADVSIANESMTAMVERNRKAITDELHVMYKRQGRADYAARLGELYCLIASMEVCFSFSIALLERERVGWLCSSYLAASFRVDMKEIRHQIEEVSCTGILWNVFNFRSALMKTLILNGYEFHLLQEISTLAEADMELYKLMNIFTEFPTKWEKKRSVSRIL